MSWQLLSWQLLILLIVGLIICAGGPRRVLRFLAGLATAIFCVLAIVAITAGFVVWGDYYKEEQMVKARAKTDREQQDKYRQEHGDIGLLPDDLVDWEATARYELTQEGKLHKPSQNH